LSYFSLILVFSQWYGRPKVQNKHCC